MDGCLDDGWMDGWRDAQKLCRLIASLFRSATTVINKPAAGVLGTRNTKEGEQRNISPSSDK